MSDRTEAMRAFISGFIAGRASDEPVGQKAQEAFERWWNDRSVAIARAARRVVR